MMGTSEEKGLFPMHQAIPVCEGCKSESVINLIVSDERPRRLVTDASGIRGSERERDLPWH